MAEGRDFSTPVSSIRNPNGTDVNFGALTKQYLASLSDKGTQIRYGHEVTGLKRNGSKWIVTVKNVHTKDERTLTANFVFVGAGGDALPLLQKARIDEIRGFGGFPVSGQWLRCTNDDVIAKHDAKVYGKASVGTPPMSVPHLDTRIIDGKRGLLFGPYAGWNMKFLKKGSNLGPDQVAASGQPALHDWCGRAGDGSDQVPHYRGAQGLRRWIESLREYIPNVDPNDWELITAGQRVQVIKPMKAPTFGTLEFGTAVINSWDGTIAGLMGASPGASIAPAVMISLIERCFGRKMGKSPQAQGIGALLRH